MTALKKLHILIVTLTAITVTVSCRDDAPEGRPDIKDTEVSITLNETRWTYFSFATAEVVGTSDVNSTEEDEQWSNRTDWDIALWKNRIRTNGGTSGSGAGAAAYLESADYDEVDTAEDADFREDDFSY